MKITTKILCVTFILAILVTALATLAFANTDGAAPAYNVHFSDDFSASEMGVTNGVVDKDDYGSITDLLGTEYADSQIIAGDNSYLKFKLDLSQTKAKVEAYNADNGGTYDPMKIYGNPYINISTITGANNVLVANSEGGDRNADWLILDFDMSTDTEFIDGFNINMIVRSYNSSKNNFSSSAKNRLSVYLLGNNAEDGYSMQVKRGNSLVTTLIPVVDPQNGWVNFTMVVDLSKGNSTAYFYIDGYYVGTADGFCGDDGARLDGFRFNVVEGTVADSVDSSILFDNVSVRSYPVGYESNLADLVGCAGVQLDQIDELSYTQDNCPGATGNPATASSAFTVQRGEQTLRFATVAELERALKAGDSVTVNRNVAGQVLVLPENVTFNTGDYTCQAVRLSDLITNEMPALDFIIRGTNGAILDYGVQNQENVDDTDNYVDKGDTDVLRDKICAAISSDSEITVLLLNDIKLGKDISNIKRLTFDLNGHTLTLNSSGKNVLAAKDNSTRIHIRGGSLVLEMDGASISNFGPYLDYPYFIFEDITELSCYSGKMDQRGGCVVYKNVKFVDHISKADFVHRVFGRDGNHKSVGLRIEDSTFELSKGFISITNLSTGGNKYGETNFDICVKNSTITSDGTPFQVNFFANTKTVSDTDTSMMYTDKNFFDLMADGMKVTSPESAISIKADTTAPGMINTVNIQLSECTFSGMEYAVVNNMDKAYGVPTLTFGVGAKFSTVDICYGSVKYAYNGMIARTNSEPGVSAMVVEQANTFRWIVLGDVYEENWVIGERPAPEDCPASLPESTSYYYYEWVEDTDSNTFTATPIGTVSVEHSLSLGNGFSLNFYIPSDANINYVRVNGVDADLSEVTVDGADYVLATSRVVHPLNFSSDHSVEIQLAAAGRDVISYSRTVSMVDYCYDLLNSESEDADIIAAKPLAAAIVAYVNTALVYMDRGSELESYRLLNVMNSEGYKANKVDFESSLLPEAVDTMDTLTDSLISARLNLADGFRILFEVADGFAGDVTFTYGEGELAVTETVTVNAGDEYAALTIPMARITETVTVTVGQNSAQYNLSAYYASFEAKATPDGSYSRLLSVIRALAVYSSVAAEYVNGTV